MLQNIDTDRLIEFVINHNFLFLGLLIITILLLQDIVAAIGRKHQLVTPAGVIGLLEDDAGVLDISENSDFKKAHIASAIHIPIAKLDDQAGSVEMYRNRALIVTCPNGSRSVQACKKLTKLGFNNLYLLQGGMQAWQESNLPIEKGAQNK